MQLRIPAILAILIAAVWVAAPAAAKGPFDGSKPLLCAISETDECTEESDCLEGEAEDVRAPRFVRIDVKGEKIEILDEGREGETTKIQHVSRSEDSLILQGVEAGAGWSLHISGTTGDTTLSISGDGVTVSAFGACTTL